MNTPHPNFWLSMVLFIACVMLISARVVEQPDLNPNSLGNIIEYNSRKLFNLTATIFSIILVNIDNNEIGQ